MVDMSAKKMGAAQFKEKCLALLDEVGPEGIIVTKHGRPIAKIRPWREEDSREEARLEVARVLERIEEVAALVALGAARGSAASAVSGQRR